MALTEGSNCGFVLSAPSGDPDVSHYAENDALCTTCKFTSPAGSNALTEIGWYCYNATEEANFEVGIYSSDGGDPPLPDELLASSGNVAKGTAAGWKAGAVSLALAASTDYFLAVQIDDTATSTRIEYDSMTGPYVSQKAAATALPSPYGAEDGHSSNTAYAIYALYEAAGGANKLLLLQNTLGGDANRMTA